MGGKIYSAIGLMSGTSLDGEIDVALIRTDGRDFVEPVGFRPFPYDSAVRDKVRACFGRRVPDAAVREAESLVTTLHIEAVKASGFQADIIGFHGQTITHDPAAGFTWQIGDGAAMARETGMDTVCDFRSADIRAGGQGAPLIPLYHAAMAAGHERPVAILNLGGVANVTFIGAGEDDLDGGPIFAFDTGPANAMMDDFMRRHCGAAFDAGGALARAGRADAAAVADFMQDAHFQKTGPKSLDRNAWGLERVTHLDPADAMATLCAMTAGAVRAGLEALPARPVAVYVCGGGRKNDFLMERLAAVSGLPVRPVEALGRNGDATEAEGFGYLAVRSVSGLPLSLPSTTGVPEPITGGVLHRAGKP